MKCSNCGKLFDYDKYYGICPKCGTFNRKETEEEEHARFHEQYDAAFSHDAHTGDPSLYTYVNDGINQEPQPEKENAGKQVKGCLVYALICVIISFVSFIGIGVVLTMQEDAMSEEALLDDELLIETHEAGEVFAVGIHRFEVTGARVLEHADVRPEFPDGEKCVAVTIRRTCEEEYPDYEDRADLPYAGYSDVNGRIVYKQALDANSGIEEYEDYYGFAPLESYEYEFEPECEGELVFFVDEAAQELTLCFEERKREENSMEQLVKVCEVTLPILEEVAE